MAGALDAFFDPARLRARWEAGAEPKPAEEAPPPPRHQRARALYKQLRRQIAIQLGAKQTIVEHPLDQLGRTLLTRVFPTEPPETPDPITVAEVDAELDRLEDLLDALTLHRGALREEK